MARLSLTFLGAFKAQVAGRAPLALPRKTQALLVYLALGPKASYPRAELATLLWGDTGDPQARGSLRQALAALREAVGGGKGSPLAIDARTVALARDAVECDALKVRRL